MSTEQPVDEPLEMTIPQVDALGWEAVSSTNVRRLAWRQTTDYSPRPGAPLIPIGDLFVDYGTDETAKIYRYAGVTEGVYNVVKGAHSIGGMINKVVKGRFAYDKVIVVPEDAEVVDANELATLAETALAIEQAIARVQDAIINLDTRMANIERGLSAIRALITNQQEEQHADQDPQ